jgi:osmotically-inducible protein OsmY
MKTDRQLQDDVIAELRAAPGNLSTSIGIAVKDGVVSLAGDLGTHAEKSAVERLAQQVPGVRALAVHINVAVPGHGASDVEIAHCVEAGLTLKNGVHPHVLRVVVEQGHVRLTGDVDSEAEKHAALDSIRYLRGVASVIDEIAVKPTVSLEAVRRDIEGALHRIATADAAKIAVTVFADEVTLTGSVRSWSESQTIVKSVEDSRGVRHVVDRLRIED